MSKQGKTSLEIRREVTGDVFIECAMGNAITFTRPLQDSINEHTWGSVRARGALPHKTRSPTTLTVLTALKCPQELKGHACDALNNGYTVKEIREVLLHCVVYAGVLATIDTFRAAQKAIDTWQDEQSA